MTTLVIGILLAVTGLAFVLWPLLGGRGAVTPPATEPPPVPDIDPEEQRALEALEEIEFDRATGKLSDRDYQTLRARYEAQARAARDAREERERAAALVPPPSPADDEVEAALAAYRRTLSECPACGSVVREGARFCSNCGKSVAP